MGAPPLATGASMRRFRWWRRWIAGALFSALIFAAHMQLRERGLYPPPQRQFSPLTEGEHGSKSRFSELETSPADPWKPRQTKQVVSEAQTLYWAAIRAQKVGDYALSRALRAQLLALPKGEGGAHQRRLQRAESARGLSLFTVTLAAVGLMIGVEGLESTDQMRSTP
ncbi:MAG: hypothetical protein VYD19_04620 [Myxococcota bacterium]|nr:hypothetical protein [Myxococcota bacterium]